MTDDLTTWLRATLDAVEAAVIAYREGHPGPCLNYEGQRPEDYTEYDSCYLHVRDAEASPYRDAEFGLAEVDAKRRILDAAASAYREAVMDDHDPGLGMRAAEYKLHVIPLLALPHAGREGYREDWKPT